ncbi:putative metallopeptidase [Bordetella bronchiseptica]|uniref:putative metallopeptidase n=1 Tax=Bordetella bronchiseptica TaxID=518 RepID=UPI00067B9A10|nr:putative metallopeptidase [Bordetella bronchiseptica]
MALTDKQRRGALRPGPPSALLDEAALYTILAPAPEVSAWAQEAILADDGPLHNPDHSHLIDADLEFLWASHAFTKQGRTVLGQCEQVAFRAGGWQKARQEQQFYEWFGRVPKFVITLAADYCAQCSDLEFCALVEHELCHITHLPDKHGSPAFGEDGLPKLGLRGHDVEEFIGVVARYGPSPDVARMIEAAKGSPQVGAASIAHACGTCLRVAA